MGTVAEKLTYLNDTRLKIKDGLNKFGAELTENDTFRSYSNVLNDIYDKLPKVSGNGSNFTLENAQNGKLDLLEMGGNTIQGDLPSEYTQVDYIESSGTQYIDTGVNADSNLRTILDFQYMSEVEGETHIGAIANSNQVYTRYHMFLRNSSTTLSIGINNITQNTIARDTNRHNIDISKNSIIVDTTEYSLSISNFDTQMNFYLFGRNSNDSSLRRTSKNKLYKCKMYYNNVLVRDFIPCYRNSDNEVGLYDLVNDVFYTNQGTGVFTYGALAPTPDSPIDIEVVENKQVVNVSGKNLFDKNNLNKKNVYLDSSNKIIGTSSGNGVLYIPCEPNTTYTVSKTELFGGDRFCIFDTIDIPTINDYALSYEGLRAGYNNAMSLTITTSSTANYLCIFVKANTSSPAKTFEEIAETIQVEKNSTATTYEPYHNQDYEIDLHGKNLFDKDNIVNGYVNAGGNITDLAGYKSTLPYIEIKPNTQYYKSESGSTRWKYYDENKVVYSSNTSDLSNATAEQVFTTPSDVKYLRFTLSDNKVDNFILAESSTSIEYESFYNYELCKIGDYKDAIFKNNQLSSYYDSTLDEDGWYIKKEIDKIVLNGSEDITIDGAYSGLTYRSFNIKDYMSLIKFSSVCICDKLLYSEDSIYTNDIQGIKPTSNGGIKIKIFDSSLTTIGAFQSWLSNNNLLVYFILATPTYEKITNSTLISQLEAIETETGTNNFEVSNENHVLPSLNVKRLKELDKLS